MPRDIQYASSHKWNDHEIETLDNYSRYIIHMRAQFQSNRFGLFFGSGVSMPMRIPKWNDLIDRIATDPDVQGEEVLKKLENQNNNTSKTQLLFQCFKQKNYASVPSEKLSGEFEPKIIKHWRDIIHKHLYSSAIDGENISEQHPYLGSYIGIIKKNQLTINYNFDDLIERALLQSRTDEERKVRTGYETVWHHRMQFKTDRAIIYHPNGFLPQNLLENPSEKLVFSEYEFADQLIGSMSGHYASLSNHLYKNTCLFIGLSLEDNTLKHLLRQNAIINPGHYHYFVYFLEDELSEEHKQTIFDANFEVYNLVTMFLDNEGIKALGNLIQINYNQLKLKTDERKICLKYIYYISGVIGVGKTTSISYFRSLLTLDEWFEQRLELLAKPFNELTEPEKLKVDDWIANQFFLKNNVLRDEDEGIFIIDRPPMDPIAFTYDKEKPEKAKRLLSTISPGESGYKVQDGTIILLIGDETQICNRISYRGRTATPEYIKKQEEDLLKVYKEDGCVIIDTRGLSVEEVVHLIAKVIYTAEYTPQDLHAKLLKIAERTE